MKKRRLNRSLHDNFFREMNYELAGDIGIINNEEMKNNKKLIKGRKKDTP